MQKPLFFLGLSFSLFLSCQTALPVLEIVAGETGLPAGLPIQCELPPTVIAALADNPDAYGLSSLEEKLYTPLQLLSDQRAVFVLREDLQPGTARQFRFVAGVVEDKRSQERPRLVQTPGQVQVFLGDRPVMVYHTQSVKPPHQAPDYYRRSGFIHPVYSPGGQILTDGFPEGHTHQHGLFFAWVNTTFRGQFTDFWNQQKETGTVRHVGIDQYWQGPVAAGYQVQLEHVAIQEGDSIPALAETWSVTAYRGQDYFLFDLVSEQQCQGQDTLFIHDYHYGGLGFRGSAEWNVPEFEQAADSVVNYIGRFGKGGFLTREGLDRIEGNHSKPQWVSFHGEVAGQAVGVIIMDHPDNFRAPQPVRIHPSMPYFCFAPMVGEGFHIAPGDTYISRYRFLVHQGEPDPAWAEAMWQAYRQTTKLRYIEKN